MLVSGATGGIGSRIAFIAAQSGWLVLVGYGHSQDRANKLAFAINDAGGSAIPVCLPLDNHPQVAQELSRIEDCHIDIEALVLCASAEPLICSFAKTPAN